MERQIRISTKVRVLLELRSHSSDHKEPVLVEGDLAAVANIEMG